MLALQLLSAISAPFCNDIVTTDDRDNNQQLKLDTTSQLRSKLTIKVKVHVCSEQNH